MCVRACVRMLRHASCPTPACTAAPASCSPQRCASAECVGTAWHAACGPEGDAPQTRWRRARVAAYALAFALPFEKWPQPRGPSFVAAMCKPRATCTSRSASAHSSRRSDSAAHTPQQCGRASEPAIDTRPNAVACRPLATEAAARAHSTHRSGLRTDANRAPEARQRPHRHAHRCRGSSTRRTS